MIIESKITDKFIIFQDTDKFKFGTDSVLLAGFANIKRKDRVLDLCSGTGAVGFISYIKCNQKHTILSDIDPEAVELSRKSAEYNSLSDRFSFIASDIKDFSVENNSIDYITVNPPYFKENSGKINRNEKLVNARHTYAFSLDILFKKSFNFLKEGGKIAIIQRTDYLSDVIFDMKKNNIEPKRLRMVHSYKDRPSNLFLLEGVKNGGTGLKCMAPLILYNQNGITEEFKNIQTAR